MFIQLHTTYGVAVFVNPQRIDRIDARNSGYALLQSSGTVTVVESPEEIERLILKDAQKSALAAAGVAKELSASIEKMLDGD